MHHIVIFKDMRILQKNLLFFFMFFSFLKITKIWKRSLFSCNGNYVINFRHFLSLKKMDICNMQSRCKFQLMLEYQIHNLICIYKNTKIHLLVLSHKNMVSTRNYTKAQIICNLCISLHTLAQNCFQFSCPKFALSFI